MTGSWLCDNRESPPATGLPSVPLHQESFTHARQMKVMRSQMLKNSAETKASVVPNSMIIWSWQILAGVGGESGYLAHIWGLGLFFFYKFCGLAQFNHPTHNKLIDGYFDPITSKSSCVGRESQPILKRLLMYCFLWSTEGTLYSLAPRRKRKSKTWSSNFSRCRSVPSSCLCFYPNLINL